MNCPMCNSLVPEGKTYCPRCGQYVKQIKYQSAQASNISSQQSVTPARQAVQNEAPVVDKPEPKTIEKPQKAPKMQKPEKTPKIPKMPKQQKSMPVKSPTVSSGANASFDMGVAVNSLTKDITKLISMFAALLVFVSPIFRWYSYSYVNFKSDIKDASKANIFKLSSETLTGNKFLIFLAVAIMIMGIVLLASEIIDLIPALANLRRQIPYLPEIIGIAAAMVALFVWVLVCFNGNVLDLIQNGKAIIATKKEYLGGGFGHSNHGLGPFICIAGIALSITRRVLAIFKIEIKL